MYTPTVTVADCFYPHTMSFIDNTLNNIAKCLNASVCCNQRTHFASLDYSTCNSLCAIIETLQTHINYVHLAVFSPRHTNDSQLSINSEQCVYVKSCVQRAVYIVLLFPLPFKNLSIGLFLEKIYLLQLFVSSAYQYFRF